MAILDDPAEFQRLLRLLSRNPMFATASQHDLSRLLAVATEHEAKERSVICQEGAEAGAAYVLLDGEFEIEGRMRAFGLGKTGGGIIALSDILAPEPTYSVTLRAVRPGRYLSLRAEDVHALRRSSVSLRQALLDVTPGVMAHLGVSKPCHHHSLGAIVQFHANVPGLPLSLLIQLLAQEIVTRFPYDHVVIVRPAVPGVAPVLTPVPGVPKLFTIAGLPADVDDLRRDHDYVFLDGVTMSPPSLIVDLIANEPDHYQVPACPTEPVVLNTVVLADDMPRRRGGDLRWIDADKTYNTCVRSVRVRLALEDLREIALAWTPGASLIAITGVLKRSMYAWARAVTQRRVGVALAGGGVWSMQSVFILRELHRRGVPIDILAGPSAGSMIGAYYAVKGLPGLDLIVEQGDTGLLDVMVAGAMISPSLMNRFFEHTLGAGHTLQSLDIQFLPASTDLTTGRGVAFMRGPVALGVTAASSSTPLVPVTINRGHRFTDGAYSNNVPVQVLSYYNASLTFAANAFPNTRRRDPSWVPQCLLKLTSGGPINRSLDFVTAFNLLGSLSGETEGDFADVSWSSRVPLQATYLITTNFFLSSRLVSEARNDNDLTRKLDHFVKLWENLKNRGAPPPWCSPAPEPGSPLPGTLTTRAAPRPSGGARRRRP
jgi:NTE family protein